MVIKIEGQHTGYDENGLDVHRDQNKASDFLSKRVTVFLKDKWSFH